MVSLVFQIMFLPHQVRLEVCNPATLTITVIRCKCLRGGHNIVEQNETNTLSPYTSLGQNPYRAYVVELQTNVNIQTMISSIKHAN